MLVGVLKLTPLKMFLPKLLLLLLFEFVFGVHIAPIAEFFNKLKEPTQISAFTCSNKDKTHSLLKSLSSKYVNVHTHVFRPKKAEHQFFLIDLSCDHAVDVLKQAAELKLFQQPFRWFIVRGDSSILEKLYFGVDSKVFVLENDDQLKSIYKYTPDSEEFTENFIADWNGEEFLDYHELIVGRNRTDLKGVNINISYVITNLNSLNHLWDYRDRHVDAITKLNYILVHHLIDYVNATKTFIMQRTWGYRNATNGIYSGMAGDLQSGLAQLGGTPLFFTKDRVDIVDYIAATTPTYMKFIFRAPPLSYVTNVFTLPFDTTVWHLSFVMVAVIGVAIYLIVLWEWKDPLFRQRLQDKSGAIKANIFDVIMMELGAITQQGTDVEPKSLAGRTATIFTFLILMFMYTSYSANIVALLQSTTDSIRTLEDLLNSRIKLGVEDIVYAHYYFETASEPIRKAIYEQKIAPKGQKSNFMTVQEGIKRVQGGFFGFHVELATGYKVVSDTFQENEKCSLREIEYVNLIEPWLSMKKNSEYKEIMKVGMRRIHESGVQRREIRNIYTRKPMCNTAGSNFQSVGMVDCWSAFLIFGIGLAISFTLLFLEISVMKWITTRKSSKFVTDVAD